MTVEEFLTARLDEAKEDLLARSEEQYILIDTLRMVLEFHKNWPVLVETQPKFEMIDKKSLELVNDPRSVDNTIYQMTQRIAWWSREEYVKKFGVEAPTAPLVQSWIEKYQDHPDFNKKWLR